MLQCTLCISQFLLGILCAVNNLQSFYGINKIMYKAQSRVYSVEQCSRNVISVISGLHIKKISASYLMQKLMHFFGNWLLLHLEYYLWLIASTQLLDAAKLFAGISYSIISCIQIEIFKAEMDASIYAGKQYASIEF